MKREGDASAVRVSIAAVTAFLTLQDEAIGCKGGGNLSGSHGAQAGVVDTHTLIATAARSET